MARIQFEKEKMEVKANDPQALTPKKKRGRPADPNSLKRWMMELPYQVLKCVNLQVKGQGILHISDTLLNVSGLCQKSQK